MTVSITATPVKRMDQTPMLTIGAQLRMDGDIYLQTATNAKESRS